MQNHYGQHNLGNKWRVRRIEKGLSQREVAELVGVTHSVPSKWELGGMPASGKLASLAAALGYASVGELMADDPNAPPLPPPPVKIANPDTRGPIRGIVEVQIDAWGDDGLVWLAFDSGQPAASLEIPEARNLIRRLQVSITEAGELSR